MISFIKRPYKGVLKAVQFVRVRRWILPPVSSAVTADQFILNIFFVTPLVIK
jgi:hypothetical protein